MSHPVTAVAHRRGAIRQLLVTRPGSVLLLFLPLVGTAGLSAAYLRSALAHRRAVEQDAETKAVNLLGEAHAAVDADVTPGLAVLWRRAREEELRPATPPSARALADSIWAAQDSLVACRCGPMAPVRSVTIWDRGHDRIATFPAGPRDSALHELVRASTASPRVANSLTILRNGGSVGAPITFALLAVRGHRTPPVIVAIDLDPMEIGARFEHEMQRVLDGVAPGAGRTAGLLVVHPVGDTLAYTGTAGPLGITAELPFGNDAIGANWHSAVLTLPASMIAALVPGGLPHSPWPLLLGIGALSICLTLLALLGLARLHQLVTLREQFVAGVTHEIRTPITQILLYAETLQLERPTPEARRRAAGVIVREARRLSHLADNALAFSRARRADVSLDLEVLDLGETVAGAVHALEPLATERGTRIALSAPSGTAVFADATSIVQIVRNLVENAIRHGNIGGMVRVEVEAATNGGCVRVTDQGPGIPVPDRERVWQPFVRAANATAPGTGLGLSIVKQLVELQDGRVTTAEAPGGGALFEVWLPEA